MILLDNSFKVPSFFNLEEINKIPDVYHEYGNQQPDIKELYCMVYKDGLNGWGGSIGFIRNIGKKYPEFSSYVAEYLQQLIKDIRIDPLRVALIRTRGNITPHRDEIRKCCINIGLFNSSIAETIVSVDDTHDTIETNNLKLRCKDGHAYLLDTSKLHAVSSSNTEERYLISYGFGEAYDKVKHVYQKNYKGIINA